MMESTHKGMRSIIDTIHSIDENSKKILYKEFKGKDVHILSRHVETITKNIQHIAD